MARFTLGRPSRFFRKSSVHHKTSASDNDGHDSTTPSLSASRPATGVSTDSRSQSYASGCTPAEPLDIPAAPQATRKRSASLTKLREKFLERGADVPESVQEQRESVLVVGELEHSGQLEVETPGQRSGSETLASFTEDRKEQEHEQGRNEAVQVDEVRLAEIGAAAGEQTRFDSPPAVVLEQPTPDVPVAEKKEAVVLHE